LFEVVVMGKYIVLGKATELMRVCALGDDNRLRELLADPFTDVNKRGSHGITALMVAARFGYIHGVEELIRHGAHLNSQDDMGWTALIHAVAENDIFMAKYLAKMDPTSLRLKDDYGMYIIEPFLEHNKDFMKYLADWLPDKLKAEI